MNKQYENFLIIDNEQYQSDSANMDKLIHETIQNEKIVIIKGLVPSSRAISLRNEIYSWGESKGTEDQQTFHNKSNYSVLEKGVSPLQKTLHYYQAYNFHDVSNIPDFNHFDSVFNPMAEFFNNFRGTDVNICDHNDNLVLRPQLLHFYKGGGYLSAHFHKKDPQKIGLILMASKRFVDFDNCTVAFEKNDQVIDPIDILEPGDLLVFNYGQKHWVTACDIEEKMQFNNSGFWIYTLPCY